MGSSEIPYGKRGIHVIGRPVLYDCLLWSWTLVHRCGRRVSISHRPRLYWVDWELPESDSAIKGVTPTGRHSVQLSAGLDSRDFLEPGWTLPKGHKLPTFTTSRPQNKPGYKPAGVKQCSAHELERWRADCYRFPPYRYRDVTVSPIGKATSAFLPSWKEKWWWVSQRDIRTIPFQKRIRVLSGTMMSAWPWLATPGTLPWSPGCSVSLDSFWVLTVASQWETLCNARLLATTKISKAFFSGLFWSGSNRHLRPKRRFNLYKDFLPWLVSKGRTLWYRLRQKNKQNIIALEPAYLPIYGAGRQSPAGKIIFSYFVLFSGYFVFFVFFILISSSCYE